MWKGDNLCSASPLCPLNNTFKIPLLNVMFEPATSSSCHSMVERIRILRTKLLEQIAICHHGLLRIKTITGQRTQNIPILEALLEVS